MARPLKRQPPELRSSGIPILQGREEVTAELEQARARIAELEAGEQMWQPADGGPAISAAEARKGMDYCPAAATGGHEEFGCLEPVGHAGLHRGGVSHGRCPSCGGIEDHADQCPTPDLMEDRTRPLQEVVWGEDGIVRLEPYETGRVPTHPGPSRAATDASSTPKA
jgi:hypothetical protein